MRNDSVLQEVRTLENGVALRPIRATDDLTIGRIIREVMTEFSAVGKGFSIEDPEVLQMTRTYRDPRAAYYVLDEGGRILGGAGIGPLSGADEDICELRKMYVMPAGRNRGLGCALMDRCLEAAQRLGYRKVYLETLDTMDAAQRLYRRYGFSPIGAPMGATGHFGCDRWWIRTLGAATPPLDEGERWVDLE